MVNFCTGQQQILINFLFQFCCTPENPPRVEATEKMAQNCMDISESAKSRPSDMHNRCM